MWSWGGRWFLALVPIGVALIAHGIGVAGGLVADDVTDIVQHPVVGGSAPVTALFDYNYMGAPLGEGANTFRPLATLLFSVEWRLFGGESAGFHIMSILWFVILVVLAHRLYRRVLPETNAALATSVFAALAIHVDAVALVANRPGVCAWVFGLLALEAALERRAALAVFFYLVGLGFKESIFLLPLIVGGWLWSIHGHQSLRWREDGRTVVVLAVPAVAFLVVRNALLPIDISGSILPADNPLQLATMGERLWMPFVLLGTYLEKTILGNDLAFDYTYDAIPVTVDLGDATAWLGVGAALVGTGVIVARASQGAAAKPWLRHTCAAVVMFAISYALFSNTVFLIVTLFAERLFLGPSIFLMLALVCAGSELGGRRPRLRPVLVGVAIAGIGYQVGSSVLRTLECRSEPSLLAAQVEAQPDSVKGHLYYARILYRIGEPGEAVWELAVASKGRSTFPDGFDAPDLDHLSLEERVRRIPALLAPGQPPGRVWPAFRGFAVQTLGPGAGAAIDRLRGAKER